MSEVEAYVDIAIMYAVVIFLALVALAILVPELFPP